MAEGNDTTTPVKMDINVNKRDREDSSSPPTDSVQSPQYKSQRRASGVHDNTTDVSIQNSDSSVYTTDAQHIDKTYDLIQEMRKEQNEALAHIKSEQTATKKMFESKLDKLKKELLESMIGRIKAVKDECILEVSKLDKRLDDFETKTKAHDELVRQLQETHGTGYKTSFEPQVSIIVSNVPYQEGEDIREKMKEMINTHLVLPNEHIINCERTQFRQNRPGVVKVEMASLEAKIRVLRAKSKLREVTGYKRTYICSAKSHSERVAERNFKTLLNELPYGKSFRVTGHGIIVRNDESGYGDRSDTTGEETNGDERGRSGDGESGDGQRRDGERGGRRRGGGRGGDGRWEMRGGGRGGDRSLERRGGGRGGDRSLEVRGGGRGFRGRGAGGYGLGGHGGGRGDS